MEDFYIIRAMIRYGGSFVAALGTAARAADDDNLARIKAAFPEYWAKYDELARLKEKSDDDSLPPV